MQLETPDNTRTDTFFTGVPSLFTNESRFTLSMWQMVVNVVSMTGSVVGQWYSTCQSQQYQDCCKVPWWTFHWCSANGFLQDHKDIAAIDVPYVTLTEIQWSTYETLCIDVYYTTKYHHRPQLTDPGLGGDTWGYHQPALQKQKPNTQQQKNPKVGSAVMFYCPCLTLMGWWLWFYHWPCSFVLNKLYNVLLISVCTTVKGKQAGRKIGKRK